VHVQTREIAKRPSDAATVTALCRTGLGWSANYGLKVTTTDFRVKTNSIIVVLFTVVGKEYNIDWATADRR
jgi:hypothetical protein